MKSKLYITRKLPEAALSYVRKHLGPFEINGEDRVLPKQTLIRKLKDKEGVLCLLNDRFDREVLDTAKNLKILANCAAGYDNIDVQEATRKGVMVTNTPGALTETTAELAWSLIFAVARRLIEGDRTVRQGRFQGWQPDLLLGQDVSDKTLGIIGTGRIGEAFARMSRGFNLKLLYFSRSRNQTIETELQGKKVTLPYLLSHSDYVSIHVALTPETRHLIGEKELRLMKPNAILINTARGPVIDEKALVKALRAKTIWGAGLDVFEDEPRLAPGLARLDNVVLAPHVGSATEETRTRIALMAARNLVDGMLGRKPKNLINPEVLKR